MAQLSSSAVLLAAVLSFRDTSALSPAPIAKTPPMGWMSWAHFSCSIDDALYRTQTNALVAGGYLAAGYNSIHIDDCWTQTNPPRDPNTNQLVPDPGKFPYGMKNLSDYIHAQGVKFSLYTSESNRTCGGYTGSEGYEALDAATFASWGVDYLKVDGCGDVTYYPTGYPLMGAALQNVSRDIVYSCSWPAYLGDNETAKPYQSFIDAGCNLWRNWDDVMCDWDSIVSIIDHWGDYTPTLQQWGTINHWNDADQLIIGNGCLSEDQERTQMAIWCIIASPLIMGNDLTILTPAQQAILLNKDAIAVNQDPLGLQGGRVTPKGNTEIWARNLTGGAVAAVLLYKNGTAPDNPNATCPLWNITINGFNQACGGEAGNLYCFTERGLDSALEECCQNEICAGFSYAPNNGAQGCFQLNTNCGFTPSSGFFGFVKPTFNPPASNYSTTDLTIEFAQVGLTGSVNVYDIWAQANIGTFTSSYTAKQINVHGNAFLRLTPA